MLYLLKMNHYIIHTPLFCTYLYPTKLNLVLSCYEYGFLIFCEHIGSLTSNVLW
jgi:hypothetical protein